MRDNGYGPWPLVIVNSGTDGHSGEALRTATAHGLSAAVLVVAAGIALTSLVALNRRARPEHSQPLTGRRLAVPPDTHKL